MTCKCLMLSICAELIKCLFLADTPRYVINSVSVLFDCKICKNDFSLCLLFLQNCTPTKQHFINEFQQHFYVSKNHWVLIHGALFHNTDSSVEKVKLRLYHTEFWMVIYLPSGCDPSYASMSCSFAEILLTFRIISCTCSKNSP